MKRLSHNRLAEGEATGHFHEAVGEGVAEDEHGGSPFTVSCRPSTSASRSTDARASPRWRDMNRDSAASLTPESWAIR